LPFKAVLGVGEHAVTTESENHLAQINETSTANSLLQRNIEVKGNRVLTKKGNLIGVVSEYELDENTGKLVRLEYKTAQDESVTEIVEAENVLTYGTDVIVVKEKPATPNSPRSAPGPEYSQETAAAPSEGTALFKEKQKQFLLGKKVIQDIKDAGGKVIIPAGTVVTEEIFALAEQEGKFVELSQCAK
jgi:sporulation protein YlmC with PRC-barrel domain